MGESRKCRAAVLRAVGAQWQIEELTVDPPVAGEVVVQWKVAGLCHSDEHFVTGDMVPPAEMLEAAGMPPFFPVIAGHEGSGIVVEVGPGVTSVAVGDHVSASFIPSCGRCRYCSSGRQNLCDAGAGAMQNGQIVDGTTRHWLNGEPVKLMAKVGTFAEYTCVSEASVIKVDADLPLDAVALVSCGVATGWGSATKRADVRPGDTVVVVGIGGIGINAVQGAKAAGARYVIAVDPAFHGQGLGRSLTIAGLTHLSSKSVLVGMLHVEHDNLAAQSLYRDLGFVEHDSHCWWGVVEGESK